MSLFSRPYPLPDTPLERWSHTRTCFFGRRTMAKLSQKLGVQAARRAFMVFRIQPLKHRLFLEKQPLGMRRHRPPQTWRCPFDVPFAATFARSAPYKNTACEVSVDSGEARRADKSPKSLRADHCRGRLARHWGWIFCWLPTTF